jgi:hypothetical protein
MVIPIDPRDDIHKVMIPLRIPLVHQAHNNTSGAACMASVLYYWGLAHETVYQINQDGTWYDYNWNGHETQLYQLLGDTSQGTKASQLLDVACDFNLPTILWKTDLTLDQLKIFCLQGFTCLLHLQAWGNYGLTPKMWDPSSLGRNHPNWDEDLTPEQIRTHDQPDWSEVWNDDHWVVLAAIQNDHVVVMDPRIPAQYGRISIKDLEARWHTYGDDGKTKEYHGALILRGHQPINPNELVTVR